MMTRHGAASSILGLALAWVLGATMAAPANSQMAALGHDGEVYRLRLGPGNTFIAGPSAPASHLLALEITHQDGRVELSVVPETDLGDSVESTAALLYEESSETVFLVWDSRVNYIHSELRLASYHAGVWSDVIKVRGGWLTPRSAPRIAVTRDKTELVGAEGGHRVVQRTIIHLAWWEGTDGGDAVYYTPIILEDGQYVGTHEVLLLNELSFEAVEANGKDVSPPLLQAPSLRSGRDSESMLVGFVDAATGFLRTAEIRPTPGILTGLGDRLRHRIIDMGSLVDWTNDPPAFGRDVRREVVAAAEQLHPSVRNYLAQEIQRLFTETTASSSSLEELANEARLQIVEIGTTLLSGRLQNINGGLRHRIIDMGSLADPQGGSHVITARPLINRPAPTTPDAPTFLYLSGDGTEALVAWYTAETVSYVETSGAEAWTAPATLLLGEVLDLVGAFEILEQRAEAR